MSDSFIDNSRSLMSPTQPGRRTGRRAASVFATAAMGSWVILAAMPVVVVILALS